MSTKSANGVTLRDYRAAAEVATALAELGISVEEAALAAEAAIGPWTASAHQDGRPVELSVSVVEPRTS